MKGSLSKKERKRLALEKQRQRNREANKEHETRQGQFASLGKEAKKRRNFVLVSVSIILLLLLFFGAYALLSPGKYDDFAKCLSEKGAKMYGEDWCQYTKAQKAMFGKSFKYIYYEVKENLNLRPTWVINGETYETVQSFERLAELSGCRY